MKCFVNILVESDVKGIEPEDIKSGVIKAVNELEGIKVIWSAPAKEAEDRPR